MATRLSLKTGIFRDSFRGTRWSRRLLSGGRESRKFAWDRQVAVEGRVKGKLHAVFRTLGCRMQVVHIVPL